MLRWWSWLFRFVLGVLVLVLVLVLLVLVFVRVLVVLAKPVSSSGGPRTNRTRDHTMCAKRTSVESLFKAVVEHTLACTHRNASVRVGWIVRAAYPVESGHVNGLTRWQDYREHHQITRNWIQKLFLFPGGEG
jgi:hypothetical protein